MFREVLSLQVRFLTKMGTLSEVQDYVNRYLATVRGLNTDLYKLTGDAAKQAAEHLMAHQKGHVFSWFAPCQHVISLHQTTEPVPPTIQVEYFTDQSLDKLESTVNTFCRSREATSIKIKKDQPEGWIVVVSYRAVSSL